MRLCPDYGLLLQSQGYTREVRHCFYDFPLDHISVLSPGQFTTVKNKEVDGTEYAISLDFDFQILSNILNASPSSIVNCIKDELNRDPISPRRIQLPQTITLGVETTLGELQRGLHDDFVPLVITRVFGIQPIGIEEMILKQG